jgi:hypothetical protein
MRRRLIVALSITLGACSAIASFDGLVSEGASTDGGAAGDAALKDASLPGTSDGDTSTAVDGGDAGGSGPMSDGGVSADSGDSGYCSTHPGHLFCDDFDTESVLTANWTVNHAAVGVIGLSSAQFLSPPKSMSAVTPLNDSGTYENDIERPFAANKSFTVEAAFKVTGAVTGCDFVSVEFKPDANTGYTKCYLDISYANAGVILESQCSFPDAGSIYHSVPLGVTAPNFQRVRLKVDLSTATVTGVFAGATKTVPIPLGLGTVPFRTNLGVVYSTNDADCAVRVDDVIVDSP